MRSCTERLKEMESDSDEDEGQLASAQSFLQTWLNKRAFVDAFVREGVIPHLVPADGNCALWSLHSLMTGYFMCKNMASLDRIQELREDWAVSNRPHVCICMHGWF